jgi:competence protein ComEA
MQGRIQQLALIGYGLLLGLLAAGVLLVVGRRSPGQAVVLRHPPTPIPLRIHVTGAVAAPGVYALSRGSIVQDAIDAAGGLAANADTRSLNLAQALVDGDQINIPQLPPTATLTPTPRPTDTPAPTITVGPGTPSPTACPPDQFFDAVTNQCRPNPTPNTPSPTSAPAAGGLININTATQAELETLPRIGPAIAQRIIEYRTANGPFTSIEQIMNVKGIGPATFAQIKDLITVGP